MGHVSILLDEMGLDKMGFDEMDIKPSEIPHFTLFTNCTTLRGWIKGIVLSLYTANQRSTYKYHLG